MKATTVRQIESVQQFVQSAEVFCSLLEGSNSLTTAQFLVKLADSLATLYKMGLNLPEVEPQSSEPDDLEAIRQSIKTIHWGDDWARFRRNLDGYKRYYEQNDPSGEFMVMFLDNDLLEIWEDVKRELLVFHNGSDAYDREAVWQWRFGLQNHWGRHLVDALRGVHWILSDSLHVLNEEEV